MKLTPNFTCSYDPLLGQHVSVHYAQDEDDEDDGEIDASATTETFTFSPEVSSDPNTEPYVSYTPVESYFTDAPIEVQTPNPDDSNIDDNNGDNNGDNSGDNGDNNSNNGHGNNNGGFGGWFD